MAKVDLVMPKMGESIIEATILNWVKKEGDHVEMDESILEIATDKVDSEVPSPAEGVISKILFAVDDVVPVGTTIAIIETEGESATTPSGDNVAATASSPVVVDVAQAPVPAPAAVAVAASASSEGRFYSPLVKNMAQKEGIAQVELDQIKGSGKDGRVTKNDMLTYIKNRHHAPQVTSSNGSVQAKVSTPAIDQPIVAASPMMAGESNVEIIEMDRMRRLIADHMVNSKQTSPHVTSFVEADVTNIFKWRQKNKDAFQQKFGEKITFTPIFIEAVVRAIHDFPMVNVSVDGKNIIRKKNINIGMATALPSGNLIVPVIKDADHLSLIGLAKSVNGLANKARNNKLKPDDIQNGTFTITNVGTFGNVMGTPIINQPQVAILAVGAIRKKPAVVETEFGDLIAVRHMMFLSLSYDHRVVDGFLGGSFLRKIADYMEAFDINRSL